METEKELNEARQKAIAKVYEKIAETGMVTQNQLTRDLINAKTIQDYRDLAQSYQNQLYNTQLATSIVNSLRPYPVPAYTVSNPYAAQTA